MDGTVYANDGIKVVALDPASGKVKWASPCSSNSLILSRTGTVYCSSLSGSTVALDGATGAVLWSREQIIATACAGDGTLYGISHVVVGGANAYDLVALDGATGNVKWHVSPGPNATFIPDSGRVEPIVGKDGTIYIATYSVLDGQVSIMEIR